MEIIKCLLLFSNFNQKLKYAYKFQETIETTNVINIHSSVLVSGDVDM
jgi:hypothetical protein